MAKQGEIDYIKRIGEEGARHALGKPFSDEVCGRYLMDMGAIMTLLPKWPQARILDIGVGTGWTSVFMAKRGYGAVGKDSAPDMINLANENKALYHVEDRVTFIVGDFETLPFANEFDAALFYDSLHHAVDERAALDKAYHALKPDGACITVEPGEGHSQDPVSQRVVAEFGVTEKDMPPHHIMRLGREIGFRRFAVYARTYTPALLYDSETPAPPPPPSPASTPGRVALVRDHLRAAWTTWRHGPPPSPTPAAPPLDPPVALRASNIVVLYK